MKEAARLSVLSHKCENLWMNFPKLNFEDVRSMEKLKQNYNGRRFSSLLLDQERYSFISWVNQVVEKHLGPGIDELRVSFDLDSCFQSDIDKLLAFAFRKGVKKLELDFKRAVPSLLQDSKCNFNLPLELRQDISCKPALTSLCLNRVNVTAEVVEWLLNFCKFLKNLSIENSELLTGISVSSSLPLKHLKIYRCGSMKRIHIVAPDLLSFMYQGYPVELHIEKASSLTEVSVAGPRQSMTFALDCLLMYSSQLEYLKLMIYVKHQVTPGIDSFPCFTNLKHLELIICGCFDLNSSGWIALIEAAVVLQKLTLKVESTIHRFDGTLTKDEVQGRPLKCLKTLEIFDFLGSPIDLGLTTYVLKNATILEEVKICFFSIRDEESKRHAQSRAMELKKLYCEDPIERPKLIFEDKSIRDLYIQFSSVCCYISLSFLSLVRRVRNS